VLASPLNKIYLLCGSAGSVIRFDGLRQAPHVGGKLMRTSLLILHLSFYCSIISCRAKHKNIYDEVYYDLIKVDTANGKVGTKFYTYRYDSSRKMQIDYWSNGKLMAKTFSHFGKLDGRCVMYDTNGINIIVIDSFKDGVKVTSKQYH
jgi:hypothetical protein